MKKLNIIIAGLAVLVLTGCKSLYGKYERPEVQTSGLVRDAMSAADTLAVGDTASFGNLPWRSVFTDPQLQVLIERGLNHNTNLLNAALNVQIAEAQLKSAKLAFLPSFSFSPQGTIASWDGNKATKTYSLLLECRPLRQSAVAKAGCTDDFASLARLSGGSTDQSYCQYGQHVLHAFDA